MFTGRLEQMPSTTAKPARTYHRRIVHMSGLEKKLGFRKEKFVGFLGIWVFRLF